ncbi:MAG TPA: hypothetical protein VFT32_05700 [Candidatus Eisenbacteria bacterium]|nr:hypothetical protein [Candidatus Eisenbacteria bacterium]
MLLLTSCAGGSDVQRYEAEFGAWALELTWRHDGEAPQAPDSKAGSYRFESLKLILDPKRSGEDLPIDGESVTATFEHGGRRSCTRPHRVTGTVRLLERRATDVRARVDAVMHCPDGEPATLKGEFTFETKVPP